MNGKSEPTDDEVKAGEDETQESEGQPEGIESSSTGKTEKRTDIPDDVAGILSSGSQP